MKRLILIGGHPGKAGDDNALSYALRSHAADEVSVAFCNFARTETQRDDTDKDSIKMFKRFGKGKNLAFETMTTETFREISTWANIIYMPGGDPAALLSEVAMYPELAALWDDKIIAGSSAGADVMCSRYVYLQDKTFGDGLGWVKATCIPHWGTYEGYEEKDWEQIRSEALKRSPDLPVLSIPEGHFVEFAVQ